MMQYRIGSIPIQAPQNATPQTDLEPNQTGGGLDAIYCSKCNCFVRSAISSSVFSRLCENEQLNHLANAFHAHANLYIGKKSP